MKRYSTIANFLFYFVCFSCFYLMFLLSDEIKAKESGQRKHNWQFSGWYGGGCYPNVEFDPNVENRVYLVSDVAGIWRSDNLGDRWSFINNGLTGLNVALLKIAPSDSRILYAGTQAGLFVSRDSGNSWQPCTKANGRVFFERPANYSSIDIFDDDAETLCIGTASGSVFFSQNGGKAWQILGRQKRPFGTDSPITTLLFSKDGKYIYVSSLQGLARYSFRDSIWTILKQAPVGITDFYISKELPETIFVAGHKELYISYDGGKAWTKTTPIPEGKIYRISVVLLNDATFLAIVWNKGWKGGVFLSKDLGKTWIGADKNMYPDIALNPTRKWARAGGRTTSLKINPFNPKIMFRTDWWGVWRSDDGGKSWREKIMGAPNSVGSDIHIDAQGNIYVATMDNGLLKATNGRDVYQSIFPKQGYQPDVNGHVWRVLSDPKNSEKIIATSSPWDKDINQVIISEDGGRSFVIVRKGLAHKRPKINTFWAEGYPRAIAIDHRNPSLLYLGIDGDDGGGLYVSCDGGYHWKYSQAQPGSKKIYNGLAIDPLNSERIFWGAGGEKGGVYISNDRGKSWRYAFNQMTEVFDLAINQEGYIYICGDYNGPAIFISADRGHSWSILKKFSGEGAADALFIHPNDPQQIGVSTIKWHSQGGGEIFWSEDRGKSWRKITGNLPYGTGAAAMAYHPIDNYLYIIRYAGSVYKTKLSFTNGN
jgi:photosystem II stability/assembly factor-like uncharacterized protein